MSIILQSFNKFHEVITGKKRLQKVSKSSPEYKLSRGLFQLHLTQSTLVIEGLSFAQLIYPLHHMHHIINDKTHDLVEKLI